MERSIAEKIADEKGKETPKKNLANEKKEEVEAPVVGSGVPFDMSGMPGRNSRRRSKDRQSLPPPPMGGTPPPERALPPAYFSKMRKSYVPMPPGILKQKESRQRPKTKIRWSN